MKYDKPDNNFIYKEAISANKDDLYNLSVRKKVVSVCRKLITDLKRLEDCYEMIKNEDEIIEKFLNDNNQIKIIGINILKTINSKEKIPDNSFKIPENVDIRLHISAILTEIADSIIGLSNIISIRHIERELIYASELILSQLIYILPYKLI